MENEAVIQAGHVSIDGLTVAYRLEGPAGAPVVMFGNSLMADYGMWDDNVAAFTDRYRVLRHDMRGHGGSSAVPGDYSTAMLARDAIALLDWLGIDRVVYVGLSLGGMVGQVLGAAHGQRLHGLALCDTSSDTSFMCDAWNQRITQARTEGLAALVEPTLQRWFTPALHERAPQTIARMRAMLAATSAVGYAGCAAAVRDVAQVALLKNITVPTLVVVGRFDPSLTVEHAQVLHDHISGAAGAGPVVIDAAAHLPNIEQALAFNTAVRAFVDGLRLA